MKYFFILGSNSALSIAELSAVFNLAENDKKAFTLANNQVLVVELEQELDPTDLIKKLGGTIKIGVIKAETKRTIVDLLANIKELVKFSEKKFYFGFSSYVKGLNIKPLAMELKKYLKENQVVCRWVISREPVLSSVVVEQNDLVAGGAEFVLFEQGNMVLIGQTLAVQPFKELSFRDYGRPARDDYSGMLPPKLAQIMINLALRLRSGQATMLHQKIKENFTLLDPFCGSGTVLTEAALMGYDNLIGSDLSEKAVSDTKKNLEWTKVNYELRITNYELYNKSAIELSSFIKLNSVDAIVTEPYLGPQRGSHDIRAVVKELEELYVKSILEFKKVLKIGGRVVMIWPVFRNKQAGNIMLKKNIVGDFKIVNALPVKLSSADFKLSNRGTIIYGRADQRVWREIVVLEK